MRDVRLDRVSCVLGWFVSPELVDQGLGRDELAGTHDQVREDGSLLRPAQRDRLALRVHLKRPEDPKLHPGSERPPRLLRRELFHARWDIRPLGHDRDDADRVREPLQVQLASIQISDAFDRASEMDHALAGDDLARIGLRAEPRGQVECSPPVAALDHDGLADVQSYPDGKGQIRPGRRLLEEPRLKRHRRPDRATRRSEDHESLVATQLHLGSVPIVYLLPDDGREPGGKVGGVIAALAGEPRVSADVRDQEGPEPVGRVWIHGSPRLRGIRPVRTCGSL